MCQTTNDICGGLRYAGGILVIRAFHSGLVSRIIRDLDSVMFYVVKVKGSSGWIGTVCNQSNMENGSSLHMVLPDSALNRFTTMTVHRR